MFLFQRSKGGKQDTAMLIRENNSSLHNIHAFGIAKFG